MVTSSDVHVGLELGRLIQQTRTQRKMSQKDLAAVRAILPILLTLPHSSLQKINEKAVVVVDYESGRALPNPQIISKLERALGIHHPLSLSLLSLTVSACVCRCSSERRKSWTTKTGWKGTWPYLTHSIHLSAFHFTLSYDALIQHPLLLPAHHFVFCVIIIASQRSTYAVIYFRILLTTKALQNQIVAISNQR